MLRSATDLAETTEFLRQSLRVRPRVGLVLGSGLGKVVSGIEEALSIPYREIPHFPVSTVEGHAGLLVSGTLAGSQVLAMAGRFHYYEGYSMAELTYPVRVMRSLGIEVLVVTNSSGGVNPDFQPGDLMLISDHINLMGDNPLRGKNEAVLGPRFPDMSRAYPKELRLKAYLVAKKLGITLREGTYAGMSGPSYETPAEIRFLRVIGADAVGMSTIPEVVVANHGGLQVLGISCITNMAAGILPQPLNHEEVLATADRVQLKFSSLVEGLLGEL